MAKQVINVGRAENDSTGDSLRSAGIKINNNFTELYNTLGGENGQQLSIVSRIIPRPGIALSAETGTVVMTLLPATQNQIGGIIPGDGITVDENGVASVQVYALPKASGSVLGGIKVGARLSIDQNGVLSADAGAYTLPTATTSVKGGVKIDGTSITIADGVISSTPYSLPVATSNTLGGIKVGDRLSIVNGVLSADVQTFTSTPSLNTGSYSVTLQSDGRLSLTSSGVKIQDTGVVNALAGVATPIYSTDGNYVRAMKMVIFAEKLTNGYESQACELVGTVDESANIIYSSVYGVVYTGVGPLFSISSSYSLATRSYVINATPTGTDNLHIRTVVTEMYGTAP